ncbi:MAG: hypothetical protein ACYDH9_04225 [Limisphaerales bacterium]
MKPTAKSDDPSAELNGDLSLAEKADLQRHETIIRRGLGTFYAVGKALAEIRDRRLYRQTHPTFEAYCRSRWEMGVRRARQLCNAAEVVDALQNGNNCSHLAGAADGQQSATATHQVPTNEAQARVLSTLPPAERLRVWQQAVAAAPDGKPTATLIQRIIRERAPAQPAAAADASTDQTDSDRDREESFLVIVIDHTHGIASHDIRRARDRAAAERQALVERKADNGDQDLKDEQADWEVLLSFTRAELKAILETMQ